MRNLLITISILISINSFAQNKKSLLRNGNKLFAESNYNEAEIQYRKSLEKDQDYFNASFNLADAIYKQERYDEASALFNSLKDNTSNKTDLANLYHNLGNSLVKEQKIEQAIEAYKNALRINPNDQETRHNLALIKQQDKQNKQEEEDNQNKQEKEDKQNKQEKEDKQNKQEKEDKQNKQEKEDKQNKQEEQKEQEKNQEKKEEMSKETAEKMLEAIEQQEKDLQKKLQKKKAKGKRVNVLKDW